MTFHAIRLTPGEDLKQSLKHHIQSLGIQAGAILTGIGSLQKLALRLANQEAHQLYEGKFEIISLAGTLGTEGMHLHLAVADTVGNVTGGHLVEGCIIYTTAEIVIAAFPQYRFARELDEATGYQELKIYPLP